MLRSLTASSNVNLLKQLLDQTSNPDILRSQDETTIIGDISANIVGRELVFDFIDSKWDYLSKKFGRRISTLSKLIERVFEEYNSNIELEKLNNFKLKHKNLGIAERAFKSSLLVVKANIKWKQTNFKWLPSWLKQYNEQISNTQNLSSRGNLPKKDCIAKRILSYLTRFNNGFCTDLYTKSCCTNARKLMNTLHDKFSSCFELESCFEEMEKYVGEKLCQKVHNLKKLCSM